MNHNQLYRVVVTGVGMVCPVGKTASESWNTLIEGGHGISPLPQDIYGEGYRVSVAGQIKDHDQKNVLDVKAMKRMERFVQFACLASHEALEDSGILKNLTDQERYDFGVSIGVGMGGVERMHHTSLLLEERGASKVSPFFIPQIIPNMASGMVSNLWNLKGPNICTTSACSSGTHGLGEAFMLIRHGRAQRMLAGGAESAITPVAMASFGNMKALSPEKDPSQASRPFDLHRDGFVMGEGSGVLMLEELESAQERGAEIYAEIIGYGMSGDAYHMTAPAPQGEGAARCMSQALKLSQITPEEVDYINAHGTSTPLNDHYETLAIHQVFQEHATKLLISSTKGATGHLLGGAGGVEACFTVLALKHQYVPPTAGLQTPDPQCDLDYVPLKGRSHPLKVALSNSFGFGGTNATLIFSSYSPES